MNLLLVLLLFAGCHCPSPMGICGHDLQYALAGIGFLPLLSSWLSQKIKNFHFWNHKNCGHHPKDRACEGHDHVPVKTKFGEVKQPAALDCEEGVSESLSKRDI